MKTYLLATVLMFPAAVFAMENHDMKHDHSDMKGHKNQPCEKDLNKKDGKPCHHNMSKKHGKHDGGHMMKMRAQHDTSPQTREAMAANMKMHKNMDIEFTGDADIDFLKGMIAHHQGAVDMAQIQLKYGHDSRVKRMSREIIRAQNLEIKWMKSWLESLQEKKSGYQDSGWLGDHSANLFN